MQRRFALIVLTVAIVSLTTMLWSAIGLASSAHGAQAMSSLASAASLPVAAPTPTATAQASSSNSGGLDPAVVAAIIAAVAALVAALVAGGFALVQTRYNARLQERLVRVQKELDEQYQVKDQEKQREAATIEATRLEMLRAQNNEERAKAYRRALHADPRISRL
jgi:hypothetical protein